MAQKIAIAGAAYIAHLGFVDQILFEAPYLPR